MTSFCGGGILCIPTDVLWSFRPDTQYSQSFWDIGTGTGLIALHAKKKGADHVLATDLNPDAVKNAKTNGKLLNLDIDVHQADLFGNIKTKVDTIIFNPPFSDCTAKETHHISFWDKDHKTVRKFFKEFTDHLNPKGKAYIAWSSFGDTKILKGIAKENGYTLKKVGQQKGKKGFVYYVFEILVV